MPKQGRCDVVVVGASLAGCATAIMLGRAGARVALLERQPDPRAFKRVCSHLVQASAVPTLERLELLEPIVQAGGVRSRLRTWTRWGWIAPSPEAASGVNLRRRLLDPLVREAAAGTPGVELRLGWTVGGLLRDGGAFAGVAARNVAGREAEVRAPLVVAADGRDSTLAELAGVAEKRRPHGRFVYAAYYEGPGPRGAPDVSTWFMDPQWAIAAPTDEGLVLYAVMPTKDRLPEFKKDPASALDSFLGRIPDGPPIAESRRVGPLIGKIDMTNRVRGPVAPGLALVGDAALATDPLFGVGCGWALQSAEWLADSVIPAVLGEEPLGRGLARYRRRRLRELRGHAYFIHDYASGRPLGLSERMIFAAAARDPKVAAALDAVATRRAKPIRTIARVMPRVLAANVSPSRPTAPSGT